MTATDAPACVPATGTGGGGTGGAGAPVADGGSDADSSPPDSSPLDGSPPDGSVADGGAMTAVGEPPPMTGDLKMAELLINPAGTDTGREWIEVVNRSGHPVSLAGLHLADAINDAVVELAPETPSRLPAGARMVLVQSGDPARNGGLTGSLPPGPSVIIATFGTLVSLNNDGDQLTLCWGLCASGIVIDRVSWDGSLGTDFDGRALVIDDAERRCAASRPYGDSGSFGTPGEANPPCPRSLTH